jgi:DNA polymerase I-like protein with 3'-5' exonuclease and polymerase domains
MHLMRVHPDIVGVYCRGDTELTRALWDYYNPIMEEQELNDVFQLECDLIPMLNEMRMRGVPVNVAGIEVQQRTSTRGRGSRARVHQG